MANQREYIFERSSINRTLENVFKDVKRENIEINVDVLNAILDLERQNFYANEKFKIIIHNINDIEEVEFILNEFLHLIYSNCERQKLIKKNLEIDDLVKKYEEKEQECLNLKNKIITLHNTRL